METPILAGSLLHEIIQPIQRILEQANIDYAINNCWPGT